MANVRLGLFKISALIFAPWRPDTIWRHLLLPGNSVMQLTAAGLPTEITWNNYFQISTDVLFGAKGRIISLILFFLFFIFWGGAGRSYGGNHHMGIWERFQSRIKEQVFFSVAIPVIFHHAEKSWQQSSSQCCLPLLGHIEVSHKTYFRS